MSIETPQTVDMSNARIGGSFEFLSGMQVGEDVYLDDTEIGACLVLSGSRVDGDLYLKNMKVSHSTHLDRIRIGRDINMKDMKVDSYVKLNYSDIGIDAVLTGVEVKDDIDLNYTQIGRDIYLENMKSPKKIYLDHFKLGGECHGVPSEIGRILYRSFDVSRSMLDVVEGWEFLTDNGKLKFDWTGKNIYYSKKDIEEDYDLSGMVQK